jgi:hypothetical protein
MLIKSKNNSLLITYSKTAFNNAIALLFQGNLNNVSKHGFLFLIAVGVYVSIWALNKYTINRQASYYYLNAYSISPYTSISYFSNYTTSSVFSSSKDMFTNN